MLEQKYLKINQEKLKMLSALPPDEEVMMLNLLKYKDIVAETGLSGATSYREYTKAEGMFFGTPQSALIGPEDEELWDDVPILKYRNLGSFFRMVREEGYPWELREQALLDSRLIYFRPNPAKRSK
ncbi:hypothetical protein [Ulvibacterium marinum]|uniref:hypothetical protein n=1 Tax=Ulvibacterium marinum TaxID=2419782 RepID=UPI00249473E3|nr:hypothetical protein [Ulvibacterium marinum]